MDASAPWLCLWLLVFHAALKDDNDIQRQMKSLYCATNKFWGTFSHYSTAVRTTLLCLLHAILH